jgi:hypothetical protein
MTRADWVEIDFDYNGRLLTLHLISANKRHKEP